MLPLRRCQLAQHVDAVLVVGHDVDEHGLLVHVLGDQGERPEKDPEEAHEVEAVPERRVGVEGGAVVPADVGRAEEGPELAERRLPLVSEGDVGGRVAEVVLVLVMAVGHDLVLLKVLAEVLRLDVEVAGGFSCGLHEQKRSKKKKLR